MDDKAAVFTLTVEDVQLVAEDLLGRSLTQKEMEVFKDYINDSLSWWEPSINCIERAVMQKG